MTNTNQPSPFAYEDGGIEKVLYIKLGRKGDKEEKWLRGGDRKIGVHYSQVDHALCASGNWEAVKQGFVDSGRTPGTASNFVRELKLFYKSSENTLWVTFHKQHLWWCRHPKGAPVALDDDGWRVYGGAAWSNADTNGKPLRMDELSGQLTKTAGYRGTICELSKPNNVGRYADEKSVARYVVDRINARLNPTVVKLQEARENLVKHVGEAIKTLTPGDFELLVDLIFRQAGYLRVTPVGGTQKDVDVIYHRPLTKSRVAVQVKSTTERREYEQYLDNFNDSNLAEAYFVYHSLRGTKALEGETNKSGVNLKPYGLAKLAENVVDAGLTSWLEGKTM